MGYAKKNLSWGAMEYQENLEMSWDFLTESVDDFSSDAELYQQDLDKGFKEDLWHSFSDMESSIDGDVSHETGLPNYLWNIAGYIDRYSSLSGDMKKFDLTIKKSLSSLTKDQVAAIDEETIDEYIDLPTDPAWREYFLSYVINNIKGILYEYVVFFESSERDHPTTLAWIFSALAPKRVEYKIVQDLSGSAALRNGSLDIESNALFKKHQDIFARVFWSLLESKPEIWKSWSATSKMIKYLEKQYKTLHNIKTPSLREGICFALYHKRAQFVLGDVIDKKTGLIKAQYIDLYAKKDEEIFTWALITSKQKSLENTGYMKELLVISLQYQKLEQWAGMIQTMEDMKPYTTLVNMARAWSTSIDVNIRYYDQMNIQAPFDTKDFNQLKDNMLKMRTIFENLYDSWHIDNDIYTTFKAFCKKRDKETSYFTSTWKRQELLWKHSRLDTLLRAEKYGTALTAEDMWLFKYKNGKKVYAGAHSRKWKKNAGPFFTYKFGKKNTPWVPVTFTAQDKVNFGKFLKSTDSRLINNLNPLLGEFESAFLPILQEYERVFKKMWDEEFMWKALIGALYNPDTINDADKTALWRLSWQYSEQFLEGLKKVLPAPPTRNSYVLIIKNFFPQLFDKNSWKGMTEAEIEEALVGTQEAWDEGRIPSLMGIFFGFQQTRDLRNLFSNDPEKPVINNIMTEWEELLYLRKNDKVGFGIEVFSIALASWLIELKVMEWLNLLLRAGVFYGAHKAFSITWNTIAGKSLGEATGDAFGLYKLDIHGKAIVDEDGNKKKKKTWSIVTEQLFHYGTGAILFSRWKISWETLFEKTEEKLFRSHIYQQWVGQMAASLWTETVLLTGLWLVTTPLKSEIVETIETWGEKGRWAWLPAKFLSGLHPKNLIESLAGNALFISALRSTRLIKMHLMDPVIRKPYQKALKQENRLAKEVDALFSEKNISFDKAMVGGKEKMTYVKTIKDPKTGKEKKVVVDIEKDFPELSKKMQELNKVIIKIKWWQLAFLGTPAWQTNAEYVKFQKKHNLAYPYKRPQDIIKERLLEAKKKGDAAKTKEWEQLLVEDVLFELVTRGQVQVDKMWRVRPEQLREKLKKEWYTEQEIQQVIMKQIPKDARDLIVISLLKGGEGVPAWKDAVKAIEALEKAWGKELVTAKENLSKSDWALEMQRHFAEMWVKNIDLLAKKNTLRKLWKIHQQGRLFGDAKTQEMTKKALEDMVKNGEITVEQARLLADRGYCGILERAQKIVFYAAIWWAIWWWASLLLDTIPYLWRLMSRAWDLSWLPPLWATGSWIWGIWWLIKSISAEWKVNEWIARGIKGAKDMFNKRWQEGQKFIVESIDAILEKRESASRKQQEYDDLGTKIQKIQVSLKEYDKLLKQQESILDTNNKKGENDARTKRLNSIKEQLKSFKSVIEYQNQIEWYQQKRKKLNVSIEKEKKKKLDEVPLTISEKWAKLYLTAVDDIAPIYRRVTGGSWFVGMKYNPMDRGVFQDNLSTLETIRRKLQSKPYKLTWEELKILKNSIVFKDNNKTTFTIMRMFIETWWSWNQVLPNHKVVSFLLNVGHKILRTRWAKDGNLKFREAVIPLRKAMNKWWMLTAESLFKVILAVSLRLPFAIHLAWNIINISFGESNYEELKKQKKQLLLNTISFDWPGDYALVKNENTTAKNIAKYKKEIISEEYKARTRDQNGEGWFKVTVWKWKGEKESHHDLYDIVQRYVFWNKRKEKAMWKDEAFTKRIIDLKKQEKLNKNDKKRWDNQLVILQARYLAIQESYIKNFSTRKKTDYKKYQIQNKDLAALKRALGIWENSESGIGDKLIELRIYGDIIEKVGKFIKDYPILIRSEKKTSWGKSKSKPKPASKETVIEKWPVSDKQFIHMTSAEQAKEYIKGNGVRRGKLWSLITNPTQQAALKAEIQKLNAASAKRRQKTK